MKKVQGSRNAMDKSYRERERLKGLLGASLEKQRDRAQFRSAITKDIASNRNLSGSKKMMELQQQEEAHFRKRLARIEKVSSVINSRQAAKYDDSFLVEPAAEASCLRFRQLVLKKRPQIEAACQILPDVLTTDDYIKTIDKFKLPSSKFK